MPALLFSFGCSSRFSLWIGLALFIPLAAGCGDGRPKRVPVSGRVLIDGKPLTVGSVQVVPQNDRPAFGVLDEEGRFRLTTFDPDDGCVPGKHQVAVISKEMITPESRRWFTPQEYMNVKTSGLEIEVNGPRDDVEINLTWKGSGHEGPYVEHIGVR